MTRLQALLKIIIVLVVIIVIAIFAFWQRGVLRITVKPEIEYCVAIDGGKCENVAGEYKKKIKEGSHSVAIHRAGYIDYIHEIKISRGKELEISPNFLFAPVLTNEEQQPFYRIPNEVRSPDFDDDQWLKLSSYCGSQIEKANEAPLLGGLPRNLNSLTWHSGGKWAIGRIDEAIRPRYFVYDAVSGHLRKLDGRVQGAVPMMFSDAFVFLWKELSGDSELFVSGYNNDDIEKVTDLPGVDNGMIYLSPDETKIAFQNTSVGNSRDFYLIDRESGRREKITSGSDAFFAKWSHDSGKVLLAQRNEGQSLRWSIFDLDAKTKTDLSVMAEINEITWGFGDDEVLFIDRVSGNLVLLDVESGDREELAELINVVDGVDYVCAGEKEFVILEKGGTIFTVRFRE